MQHFNLFRVMAVGVLIMSLAILPLAMSTFAQNPSDPNQPAPTTTTTGAEDDGTNWGWLGLVGLAGLAGLMRRQEPVRHREAGMSRP